MELGSTPCWAGKITVLRSLSTCISLPPTPPASLFLTLPPLQLLLQIRGGERENPGLWKQGRGTQAEEHRLSWPRRRGGGAAELTLPSTCLGTVVLKVAGPVEGVAEGFPEGGESQHQPWRSGGPFSSLPPSAAAVKSLPPLLPNK